MHKTQRQRRYFQAGFLLLFILAPVFDIFRLDLYQKHFFFFGLHWTLGLDDLAAGRIGVGEAVVNLMLRGFLPIAAVVGAGIWVSLRYGRLYCGWLCPHFSVVESLNGLMRRAIGKHSLWDRQRLPEQDPDGSRVRPNRWYWLLLAPAGLAVAFAWATVLLTYLLPPAVVYGNLWHGALTRNQALFIGAGTLLFFIDFTLARHLFCRFGCAVGLFQSFAWMANRRALVIGYDCRRAAACADCNAACEHACPMRLRPRSIKRQMFACTQCGRCASACSEVQRGNPQGSLLQWVQGDCALDKSARDFGQHPPSPGHCFPRAGAAGEVKPLIAHGLAASARRGG